MNEQKKDFSLLRPFDLEKAKAGELLCTVYDYGSFEFVARIEFQNSVYVQISDNKNDAVYACEAHNLRMKPLCWLEGKPVYKGDELWSKCKGLENWNYIVDKYVEGQIIATEESKGWNEFLYNLSWTKQEVVKKKVKVLQVYLDGKLIKQEEITVE